MVVVPIGFVSDHMEVVYDLDTEAAATADRLGLEFARAATAGVDPASCPTVRDLLLERAAAERGEPIRPAGGGLPAAVLGRVPGGLLREPARAAPGAVRRTD